MLVEYLSLNATEFKIGRTYPLNVSVIELSFNPTPFGLGGYMQDSSGLVSQLLGYNSSITIDDQTYTLDLIDAFCEGFGGGDVVNISRIAVSCGMVMYVAYLRSLIIVPLPYELTEGTLNFLRHTLHGHRICSFAQ